MTRDEDGRYYSHYICHSAGSGKTVLMKLFGRELQQRGFVVYMLPASQLDEYPPSFFVNLAKKWAASQKEVAVLIDEVQTTHCYYDNEHWDDLLHEAPSNLLVVGTGRPAGKATLPRFRQNYPDENHPLITQLISEDMPEVLAHFIPLGEADELWETKKRALNELLVATAGQLFPFVTIAKHLMATENVQYLSNVSSYLTSEQFYHHEGFEKVHGKCYSLPELLNTFGFTYPLVVNEVFRRRVAMSATDANEPFELDLTGTKGPMVEQILAAGLSNMNTVDFDDVKVPTLQNPEKCVAADWALAASCVLKGQVWLASDVVAGPAKRLGATWMVHRPLSLRLELARDRTDADMTELLAATATGGESHSADSYLFHFVLKGTLDDAIRQVKSLPTEEHSRVYTFVKDGNTLLCGANTVRHSVVRRLPPTPSAVHPRGSTRQFSTMAVSAIRRFGRLL